MAPMRVGCPAILIALLAGLAAPISVKGDQIDDYIKAQMRQLHIPGASLAIVRDGHIAKAQGYGFANLELQASARKDTVYEIGSTSKQFTAAAIMMLVEEDKVRLEDPITKYFTEAPQRWRGITIRHLLTHTSGIQNHVAVPHWLDVFRTNLAFETTPSRDELLKMFFKLPLEFQAGETWAYDNTGYYLLGIIIEKASGKSYWQFLDERIFKPLGMRATRNTDPQPIVPNRASGYEWKNNRFENRPVLLPAIAFSAGSFLSTAEDMAKWDAALYSEKLLKKSSLEQMWSAQVTKDGAALPFNYGFGWFVDSYHGHRLVQHSGGTPGFSSVIYRFLNDKITIIILTNHGDRVLDQLAVDLAGIDLPVLKRPEANPDPDPATTSRLKDVMSGLLTEKYESASLTPEMRSFLGTASGKALWKWIADHGAVGSFVFSDREDRGDGQVLRYKVSLGGNSYWFSVLVTKDRKIAQVYWW
ncbi:MAG: serine hydrolase [Verrucomicrobia bacterium]|nr:MAG: serine hydrolase [Verrucomicrobiota bacterium]